MEESSVLQLLLLLRRFSCVRLCATPQMAAHQAPLSLGFSRQEYWSGLPFPSPMHACVLSRFVVSDSVQPYGQQPTRLLCPQHSLGKNTRVGYHFLLHQTTLSLTFSKVIDKKLWVLLSELYVVPELSITHFCC